MNNSKLNKWERIRARGKMRYVIIHGVISWGIPAAILTSVITTLWETKTLKFNSEFVSDLLISLVVFPIFGIVFGLWTWHIFDSKFPKNEEI